MRELHGQSGQVAALAKGVGIGLVALLNEDGNGFSRCATCVAVGFPPISAMSAVIMKDFHRTDNLPGYDINLISALAMVSGATLNREGYAECEFSPQNLKDALDQYEKLTGKSGRGLIDPDLLKKMDEYTKVDANDFGPNAKFLPQQD